MAEVCPLPTQQLSLCLSVSYRERESRLSFFAREKSSGNYIFGITGNTFSQ